VSAWGDATWSCAHVREQLGGYVLGGLEREEAALVAAHLAVCASCRREYDELVGLPALLDHAAGLEIVPPRPALEERVLDAVARERGRRRRPHRARRFLPTRVRLAAGAALAGAALGAVGVALAISGDEDRGTAAAPAARSITPVRYAVALHGRWGAWGRAAVEPKASGTVVHLLVRGLPGDGDAVYEVRCEGGNWSASAGSFRTDSRGSAYAVFSTAARKGEYDRIRVVRRMHGRMTVVLKGRIG
jgi:anti-sigma factor RsiW